MLRKIRWFQWLVWLLTVFDHQDAGWKSFPPQRPHLWSPASGIPPGWLDRSAASHSSLATGEYCHAHMTPSWTSTLRLTNAFKSYNLLTSQHKAYFKALSSILYLLQTSNKTWYSIHGGVDHWLSTLLDKTKQMHQNHQQLFFSGQQMDGHMHKNVPKYANIG